jgi:hypothetical protein
MAPHARAPVMDSWHGALDSELVSADGSPWHGTLVISDG